MGCFNKTVLAFAVVCLPAITFASGHLAPGLGPPGFRVILALLVVSAPVMAIANYWINSSKLNLWNLVLLGLSLVFYFLLLQLMDEADNFGILVGSPGFYPLFWLPVVNVLFLVMRMARNRKGSGSVRFTLCFYSLLLFIVILGADTLRTHAESHSFSPEMHMTPTLAIL